MRIFRELCDGERVDITATDDGAAVLDYVRVAGNLPERQIMIDLAGMDIDDEILSQRPLIGWAAYAEIESGDVILHDAEQCGYPAGWFDLEPDETSVPIMEPEPVIVQRR